MLAWWYVLRCLLSCLLELVVACFFVRCSCCMFPPPCCFSSLPLSVALFSVCLIVSVHAISVCLSHSSSPYHAHITHTHPTHPHSHTFCHSRFPHTLIHEPQTQASTHKSRSAKTVCFLIPNPHTLIRIYTYPLSIIYPCVTRFIHRIARTPTPKYIKLLHHVPPLQLELRIDRSSWVYIVAVRTE